MDVDTFAMIAKSYFERIGKLESDGGRKLWSYVVRDAKHADVVQLLEDYAYRGEKFPSPKQFQDELAWRTRSTTDIPQKIETDDGEALCETCQEPVWWFKQGEQRIRMRGSGGVLYREHEGKWYVARCYDCGGPDWAAKLPYPEPMSRPHWKHWGATAPLRALRLRAEELWFTHGATERDEASEALSAWIREAAENSAVRYASVKA